MAKDRKKLQHIHSSIADKQPTPQSLEVGEIAVNNAANKEFLSLKNSNNKVVRFSSDGNIIEWMERKEVIPYSGVVDNVHLDTNRSNIEIKLNQVVASATTKHDDVNGAKDIDGNLVNPTTDGGITNGAGFAIDMSRYAMIGANPSFSSITVSHQSNLSGTTNISNGDSGNTLNITTTNAIISGDTLIIDEDNTTINSCGKVEITSDDFRFGQCSESGGSIDFEFCNEFNIKSNDVTIEHCEDSNGSFTLNESTIGISGNTIISESSDNTAIHADGRLGLTSIDNMAISSESGITITANDNLCATAGDSVSLYGQNETNIGVNCDASAVSSTVNINGDTNVTINAPITNISGDTRISGDLIIDIPCSAITSDTVNKALCEIAGKSDITMTKDTNPPDSSLSAVYKLYQHGIQVGDSEGHPIDINIPKAEAAGSGILIINYASTCGSANTSYNGSSNVTIAIPKTLEHVSCGYVVDSNSGSSSSGNITIKKPLNVSGVTTIGDTLIVKEGLEKTLSWEYGSVCNEPTSATSTNFKDDAKFIIPKTLSDVSCGVVDLTNSCLNINKNICVDGRIEVSNGVFNTSDRRLKENIKKVGFDKMLAAHNVTIQQFNYLNDGDKRLTYGIIAQEVQERNIPEIVYINEDGYMSVDYTSLMILKIAYLENEVERLTNKLGQVIEKLDKINH